MKLARTQRTEKMYVNTTSENYNEHLICVFFRLIPSIRRVVNVKQLLNNER